MKKKILSALSTPLTWIILLSLIWAFVFALDLLPVLRGGIDDWEWHYKPVLEKFRLVPVILGVGIYIAVGLWLGKQPTVSGLLIWSILGGIGLSLAAVHARGEILYRLYSITVSGRASGWHMAAVRIQDLATTLRDWPEFMKESASYTPHLDHTPPGMVLIYYSLSHLLDRLPRLADLLAQPLRWQLCQYLIGYTSGQYAAAWIGMLTPVWASLTVLPLYSLGRRVFSEEVARWSVLWWPLIPGLLMFAPLVNTFFALPSLLAILVLWNGLQNGRVGVVLAAGVVSSVLSFLTFTFAPLLVFAGFLTLGEYWLKIKSDSSPRPKWHWPIQMGLWFGLGLSVIWVIFYVATGSSPWGILRAAEQSQAAIALARPYLPWLVLNLNDFFMFTGWPLTFLAAIAVWTAIRNIISKKSPTDGDVMILAAGLTLIILDLFGTPRGETGRILLFLSPWMLLTAGQALKDIPRGGWVLTAIQGIAVIVMVVCLQVLAPEFRGRGAPIPPVVNYPSSQEVQYFHNGADFGDVIRLKSYAGRLDSGDQSQMQKPATLTIWLAWQDLKSMDTPYQLSISSLASDGTTPISILKPSPLVDEYPTTCWQPSDGTLVDRISVQLPSSETKDFQLGLALVDPQTSQPLQVLTSDGAQAQQLNLGPFH